MHHKVPCSYFKIFPFLLRQMAAVEHFRLVSTLMWPWTSLPPDVRPRLHVYPALTSYPGIYITSTRTGLVFGMEWVQNVKVCNTDEILCLGVKRVNSRVYFIVFIFYRISSRNMCGFSQHGVKVFLSIQILFDLTFIYWYQSTFLGVYAK